MIDVTAFLPDLNGKPAAVFGLGLSGLSTATAILNSGGQAVGWDDSQETRAAAQKAGIPLRDFVTNDLADYGALILAPGVPLNFPEPHPAALRAKEASLDIIGDLEILHRARHARRTVGITGTNGKSTTTALIAHILAQAGLDAMIGGNIGKPVLAQDLPAPDGTIVLEISSYQMDLCPTFRPDIAVFLNISPDHLNRHGNLENYIAAKENIFEGDGVAICGVDDAHSLAVHDKIAKSGTRKVIPISVKKEIAGGIYVKDGLLIDATGDTASTIAPVNNIPTLTGAHNHQNICAAYAVCRQLGLGPLEIVEHARTYPGLPHRQQMIRVINGIAYINDSKATNGESTAKAVASYNNIYLIAGGQAKDGGLSALEPYLEKIRHIFLIGEAMEDFARWAEKAGLDHTNCTSLDIAVLEAHTKAQADRGQPGGAGTVLLSPACASWDQFKSFEHRGQVFADFVSLLPEDLLP